MCCSDKMVDWTMLPDACVAMIATHQPAVALVCTTWNQACDVEHVFAGALACQGERRLVSRIVTDIIRTGRDNGQAMEHAASRISRLVASEAYVRLFRQGYHRLCDIIDEIHDLPDCVYWDAVDGPTTEFNMEIDVLRNDVSSLHEHASLGRSSNAAFLFACGIGHNDAARVLMEHGAWNTVGAYLCAKSADVRAFLAEMDSTVHGDDRMSAVDHVSRIIKSGDFTAATKIINAIHRRLDATYTTNIIKSALYSPSCVRQRDFVRAMMVQHGCDPERVLLYAAHGGNVCICEMAIDMGAKNVDDAILQTTHFNLCRMLLNVGADPSLAFMHACGCAGTRNLCAHIFDHYDITIDWVAAAQRCFSTKDAQLIAYFTVICMANTRDHDTILTHAVKYRCTCATLSIIVGRSGAVQFGHKAVMAACVSANVHQLALLMTHFCVCPTDLAVQCVFGIASRNLAHAFKNGVVPVRVWQACVEAARVGWFGHPACDVERFIVTLCSICKPCYPGAVRALGAVQEMIGWLRGASMPAALQATVYLAADLSGSCMDVSPHV
jgi:hypothetical protein